MFEGGHRGQKRRRGDRGKERRGVQMQRVGCESCWRWMVKFSFSLLLVFYTGKTFQDAAKWCGGWNDYKIQRNQTFL